MHRFIASWRRHESFTRHSVTFVEAWQAGLCVVVCEVSNPARV